MPWVRLNDGIAGDLKVLRLSPSAFRLWVFGLCHCQQQLSDGFIAAEILPTIHAKKADVEQLCSVLVDGKQPLWLRVDGGFQVHDYLHWNEAREVVLAKRSAGRARVAKHRNGGSNDVSNGVSNALRNAYIASREVGGTPNSSSLKKKRSDSVADPRFDQFWSAYPRKAAKGDALKVWLRLKVDDAMLAQILAAVEAQKSSDQWRRNGGQFVPYPATWLNGQRWQDEAAEAVFDGDTDITRHNRRVLASFMAKMEAADDSETGE